MILFIYPLFIQFSRLSLNVSFARETRNRFFFSLGSCLRQQYDKKKKKTGKIT